MYTKIEKMTDMYLYLTCKAFSAGATLCLSEMFHLYVPACTYQSSYTSSLHVPHISLIYTHSILQHQWSEIFFL